MTKSTLADRILMLALAVVCLGSLGWLLTHMGCAHPLGNLVALILYVASGLMLLLPKLLDWAERSLDFTEEAGNE